MTPTCRNAAGSARNCGANAFGLFAFAASKSAYRLMIRTLCILKGKHVSCLDLVFLLAVRIRRFGMNVVKNIGKQKVGRISVDRFPTPRFVILHG